MIEECHSVGTLWQILNIINFNHLTCTLMAVKKRRKRKALTLDQIRKSMSTAIFELERIYMDTGNDTDQRIRAINSLASTVNAYTRLTEAHSLEERISELENRQLKRVS